MVDTLKDGPVRRSLPGGFWRCSSQAQRGWGHAQPVRARMLGRSFRDGSTPDFKGKVAARHVLRQRAMVQFESEAREFLLKRRHRLRQQARTPGAVSGSHWFDTEALPEPAGEEVRRELAEIDAALRRIEQGSFGTCLACGGPMGLQRMRAIPEARYCVGCSGQGPEVE